MKRARIITLTLIVAALYFMQGCEKEIFTGRLIISITDDPFPVELISEASIKVFRIEAHPADAGDDLGMLVLSDDTSRFNLIELRNGIKETLVDLDIEAGEYDYLRLYIDSATLTIIDYGTYNIKVPSGSESGIKILIDPPIKVEGGLTTELVLDIDLGKSFVLNGNIDTPAGIKGFNFKPVIKAFNVSDAGSIEGKVKDTEGLPVGGVMMNVEYESEIYTAYSDTTGYYQVVGIPTGIHTLTVSRESYKSQVSENIVVIAANRTTRDFTLEKE